MEDEDEIQTAEITNPEPSAIDTNSPLEPNINTTTQKSSNNSDGPLTVSEYTQIPIQATGQISNGSHFHKDHHPGSGSDAHFVTDSHADVLLKSEAGQHLSISCHDSWSSCGDKDSNCQCGISMVNSANKIQPIRFGGKEVAADTSSETDSSASFELPFVLDTDAEAKETLSSSEYEVDAYSFRRAAVSGCDEDDEDWLSAETGYGADDEDENINERFLEGDDQLSLVEDVIDEDEYATDHIDLILAMRGRVKYIHGYYDPHTGNRWIREEDSDGDTYITDEEIEHLTSDGEQESGRRPTSPSLQAIILTSQTRPLMPYPHEMQHQDDLQSDEEGCFKDRFELVDDVYEESLIDDDETADGMLISVNQAGVSAEWKGESSLNEMTHNNNDLNLTDRIDMTEEHPDFCLLQHDTWQRSTGASTSCTSATGETPQLTPVMSEVRLPVHLASLYIRSRRREREEDASHNDHSLADGTQERAKVKRPRLDVDGESEDGVDVVLVIVREDDVRLKMSIKRMRDEDDEGDCADGHDISSKDEHGRKIKRARRVPGQTS